MLTENQRAFVASLARAPDDVDTAALWREHGCGDGSDMSVKRAVTKFLAREDTQALLEAEKRTLRLQQRREIRDSVRGDYEQARAMADMQRVLVEEVTDAIVRSGEEIAKGKLERLAAFAKVCEIGHKIAGATQGNVALTEEQRRALYEVEQAAKGREVKAPVAGDEPDMVAPAPGLGNDGPEVILVDDSIEGLA